MEQPLTITDQQRQALNEAGGGPIFVLDDANREEVVILRMETFQSLSQGFDIRDTYFAQEAALAEVWSDPELDEYNDQTVPPSDS
jgi:hypothetical protein